MTARPVKVALMSVGLGRVQRGFERWAMDLARVFEGHRDVELTTYGSARSGVPGEAVPPLLKPMTGLLRRLPIGPAAGNEEYKRDCIAFALCQLPNLIREGYDVIHVVDPPLAVALGSLRRLSRFPGKLLYTDGSGTPPEYYPRVDHLHHVGWRSYQTALTAGVPSSAMTFVPSGLDTDRFLDRPSRQDLRRKYQVADSTFVILMVSALKRDHKRVDHAIAEVSRLPGDVLLWLDGNPEDPEILDLARRLGSRCRITHVPPAEVPSLYGLADVFVHTALEEAFGLTIVEAICAGLPVLVHRQPHFEWLVDDPDCLVDMAVEGDLFARLSLLRHGQWVTDSSVHQDRSLRTRGRFDWQVLREQYAALYQRLRDCPSREETGVVRPLLASRRRAALAEQVRRLT